jgi:hypothetical protein
VEEAALLVDVEHLHRLEHLGELAGGNVGIDVEQLAVFGLGERGQDRERAGPDRSLDRRLVDADNLADEAVLVLVEVLGREDARRDGPSPGAELLESGDELEVLLEEDALRCGKEGSVSTSRATSVMSERQLERTRAILSVLASAMRDVRKRAMISFGSADNDHAPVSFRKAAHQ